MLSKESRETASRDLRGSDLQRKKLDEKLMIDSGANCSAVHDVSRLYKVNSNSDVVISGSAGNNGKGDWTFSCVGFTSCSH